MTDYGATVQRLELDGFTQDQAAHEYYVDIATRLGLHENGAYQVLHVLTKDDVTVVIEQNMANGHQFLPVAIVESSQGRIFADPTDTDLVVQLVADLDEAPVNG